MGGVGKTSLARAFAQRHLADYGIVWWVRAEDPSATDAEFRALLEILLPPGQAAQVTNARTTAFALLAKEKDPWLLVLDNVPNAASAQGLLPPAGNGHVLITSRASAWPKPTTVQPLNTDAAVELLTTQSGDLDRAAAETLAIELGGLPLALTQAAGFVRANALDLATYLRFYRDRSAELHREGRPADYPDTVATTWQLTMGRLPSGAREMLKVLAFCAPDAIPVHLLFDEMDEMARHRAIGELLTHSLVTLAESNAVTMHRLVQAVTRDQLGPHTYEWADRARALMMAALPKEPATAISLETWNALRTHVHVLLDHLPPEHPDTLITRSDLAHWTGMAGYVAPTWELLALPPSIRKYVKEYVPRAEPPNTRRSLVSWAGRAGDAKRARDLFAELLPSMERVFGAEHPNTLSTRREIAHWTGFVGDIAGARELLAELLAIQERLLGNEHADTQITLNDLAGWTLQAGDVASARELFAMTFLIQRRTLGVEHPNTLSAQLNLACSTREMGDVKAAQDLYTTLLPTWMRVMGAEHPYTTAIRYNLARLIGEVEEEGPGGGGEG